MSPEAGVRGGNFIGNLDGSTDKAGNSRESSADDGGCTKASLNDHGGNTDDGGRLSTSGSPPGSIGSAGGYVD